MAILQYSGTVNDLHGSGMKHWLGVARSEWRQSLELGHDLAADPAKRERSIEPETGPQIVGLKPRLGPFVDLLAELLDPRGFKLKSRRLFVAAEPQQQRGAGLERGEHIESWNAAAGSVRHFPVDGQHDRGAIERVDNLRRHNADDPAMPALSSHHQQRSRADVRIRLDNLLRFRNDVLFFLAAARVFHLQLFRE